MEYELLTKVNIRRKGRIGLGRLRICLVAPATVQLEQHLTIEDCCEKVE